MQVRCGPLHRQCTRPTEPPMRGPPGGTASYRRAAGSRPYSSSIARMTMAHDMQRRTPVDQAAFFISPSTGKAWLAK